MYLHSHHLAGKFPLRFRAHLSRCVESIFFNFELRKLEGLTESTRVLGDHKNELRHFTFLNDLLSILGHLPIPFQGNFKHNSNKVMCLALNLCALGAFMCSVQLKKKIPILQSYRLLPSSLCFCPTYSFKPHSMQNMGCVHLWKCWLHLLPLL